MPFPFVLVLLLPGQAPESTDAEKLFRAMEKKVAAAKTLTFTFETTVEDLPESGKFKGTLKLAQGNKSRLEGTVEMEGKRVSLKVISDGTRLVEDGPCGKHSRATPKKHNEHILDSLRHGGFIALMYLSSGPGGDVQVPTYRASEFKLGKKETVAGRLAQPIDYKLMVEKEGKFSETVWIDVETHLPIKRIFHGAAREGKKELKFKFTETYSDMAIDAKIDAKEFELPKGE